MSEGLKVIAGFFAGTAMCVLLALRASLSEWANDHNVIEPGFIVRLRIKFSSSDTLIVKKNELIARTKEKGCSGNMPLFSSTLFLISLIEEELQQRTNKKTAKEAKSKFKY